MTEAQKQQIYLNFLSSIKTEQDVFNAINRFIGKFKTTKEIDVMKRIIVNAYMNNTRNDAKDVQRIYQTTFENAFDLAEKSVTEYGSDEVEAELYWKIQKLNCLGDLYRYTKVAKKTGRLVKYALWYLTNEKSVLLNNLSNEEKLLINGICKVLLVDPVYQNVGSYDIQIFDPWISGWQDQEFLLNYQKLKNLATINFQERVALRFHKNISKPTTISPIHPGANVVPESKVTQEVQDLLSPLLNDFGSGRKFNIVQVKDNLYDVYLYNNAGIPEKHQILVGYFGKDIPALIATNVLGMRVFIHPACEQLWRQVLDNCFYRLTEAETNFANTYRSVYFWVYDLLDLSTICESDIMDLANTLNGALSALQNRGITINAHYRVYSYNGPRDFTLISDTEGPFNGIVDGSVIIVKDNTVMHKIGNTTTQEIF